ncbi:MAG: insulinase family protein [Muribaculaceae bacterium]|nr:insulinase family protein [Muribaculaceae bacterium]
MRRVFKILMTLAVALTADFAVSAQMNMTAQLPVDKDVRIGTLPNGLTYYIRHNEKPKGQADFYIAQKVGSIVEDDNQRGLAHFLEHMCFNGTTNFPGNSMIGWLEKQGVKFGENLNAYTSVDQTVYFMSNVPVAKKSVQDSVLLVLHDWANDLLLDPVEIDKERGVIHEEWRRSMVGQMRIIENLLPVMYPDSRYGYRLPIGTMEVVDNFAPETLRAYYEKWYRPDLQGIMVVGDIDVDYIEGKIKEMFSSIEMPENPAPRVYYPVADNKGTIYAIGRDKEQKNGVASLMIKTDALPDSLKNTVTGMMQNYITQIMTDMLNERLSDIASKPESPFAAASSSYGNFFVAKTKDNLSIDAVAKGEDIRPAFAAAYRELLRAARGGFTYSEFERARQNYLSSLDNYYNNRADRRSAQYVNDYVENFLNKAPIPDIDTEYNILKSIAGAIPLDAINQAIAQLVTPDNRVLMILAPDNGTFYFPTEADMAKVIADVDAETIEPFVDNVKNEPLLSELPAPGKIVSWKENDMWGATEFVMSNGIKVIVKQTKFKEDEIMFRAIARGGMTCLPEELAPSQQLIGSAIRYAMGLGAYTSSELPKYLSGKIANVMPSFGTYSRSIGGTTTPRDIKTAMELLYAAFTAPNFSEEEFAAMQSSLEGTLANQERTPDFIFRRDVLKSSYKAAAAQAVTVETVKAAKLDQIREIYSMMTANAGDYEFFFVGNVDLDSIKPLLEQYVATLPIDRSRAVGVVVNPDYEMVKGDTHSEFKTKMETPQTYAYINMFGIIPYTSKDAMLATVAGNIIGNRFLETVREEMGATYSIGARGSMSRIPDGETEIMTSFPMKPEMSKEVLSFIAKEFELMQTTVKEEEVQKQVEYLVKTNTANKERNGSWMGAMTGYALNGVDTFTNNVETAKSITVADVEDFMKRLAADGNYRVVILNPED